MEYSFPKGLNEAGRQSLIEFYENPKHNFKAFSRLRTGGCDAFSNIPLSEIEKKLGFETCARIRDRVHNSAYYPEALRWFMRGLSADDAAHKANVDEEINNNKKK